MRFIYNGFTQNGNHRCYLFDGVKECEPTELYSIWIDLSLFVKYQVLLQSGPMFCLRLLRTACERAGDRINEFRNYHASEADFASVLSERAAQAAAAALKKPPRQPFRKPSSSSQITGLGHPVPK